MTTEMDRSAADTNEFDAATAVQVLDIATDFLPLATLRQCQRHREPVIPLLIKAIESATERVRGGEEVPGMAHDLGLYLLWEFQAKEALPAILAAISLPGEGPFDLFGDAITEDLHAILACLAGDRLDVLDGLISNVDLNPYVRCSAADAYRYLVRDGNISREEAVARLRDHLRTTIDRDDDELATLLVSSLCNLNPQEAVAEIREAFDKELVAEFMTERESVEELLAAGEASYRESLTYLKPTQLSDTVEHVRDWPCFDPRYEQRADGYYHRKDEPAGVKLLEEDTYPIGPALDDSFAAEDDDFTDDFDDQPSSYNTTTIRNECPRIGRNDPCPCGSGKKYKKCCMRGVV